MMNFGLYLENGKKALVDLATGEILTETADGITQWLTAYENNYTLQLI